MTTEEVAEEAWSPSQSWPLLALIGVSCLVWLYLTIAVIKKVDPLDAAAGSGKSRKSKKKKMAKHGKGGKHKDSDDSDSDDEPPPPPPTAKAAQSAAAAGGAARPDPKKSKAATARKPEAPAHPLCFRTATVAEGTPRSLSWSACGTAVAVASDANEVRIHKLGDASQQKAPPAPVRLSTARDPVAFAAVSSGTDAIVALTTGLHDQIVGFAPDAPGKPPKQQWEAKIPGNYTFLGFDAAPARSARVAVACTDKTQLLLFNAANGSLVATLDTAQLKNHMAALRPDGRLLACAAFTALVKVWWLRFASGDGSGPFEGAEKVLEISQPAAACLGFSPCGRKLATAAKDGVRVWDLGDGYVEHQRLKFHPPKCTAHLGTDVHPLLGSVSHVAFGPGDVIAAASGRSLLFLCAQSRRTLEAVESAHEEPIDALAWAPSGDGEDSWGGGGGAQGGREAVLASAGRDRKVRLWHAPKR